MRAWVTVIALVGLLGCSESGPPAGKLRIHVRPGGVAQLFVDAVNQGPLLDNRELELEPGRHIVEARQYDHVVSAETVLVRASELTDVHLAVPPIAAEPEPEVSPPLPHVSPAGDRPSRADVVSAMRAVSPAVQACGGDTFHGVVPVHVVFTGVSGLAHEVDVLAGDASGSVRACVRRAVRGATVPPFSQRQFTVNYPFRL